MRKLSAFIPALFLLMSLPAFAAAKITVVNIDAPGEGFNDPTRAKRVGNNPGKTVGEQRLIAFQFAADIWGSTITSSQEIKIQASFDPLTCTATGAVLGSAGAIQIFSDFPNAQFPSTWYHVALANKLAEIDLAPGPSNTIADDIRARFNSNIGQTGCLETSSWYYGLDTNQAPGQINLVTVLLHEFAHGLGFANFVDDATGKEPGNQTDIYARQTLDTTTGLTWNVMNNAERKNSAINSRHVVWTGQHVTSQLSNVLSLGVPFIGLNTSRFDVGTATFGAPVTESGISGQLALVNDAATADGPSTTDGCTAITNAPAVSGRIAILDRGSCTFVIKAKNAQNAGAIGVIIADNVAGTPAPGMSGSDPTITIPAVRVTLADGNTLKSQLGSTVSMKLDMTQRAGADASGHAHLNAPNPVQPGSSISHWDTIATPNQLMEPSINDDLTHSVTVPQDLTFELLKDLGW